MEWMPALNIGTILLQKVNMSKVDYLLEKIWEIFEEEVRQISGNARGPRLLSPEGKVVHRPPVRRVSGAVENTGAQGAALNCRALSAHFSGSERIIASRLHSPAPCAAKNRNMKQSSTAGSP